MGKALQYRSPRTHIEPDAHIKLELILQRLSESGALDKILLLLERSSVASAYLLERADTDSGRERVTNVAQLLGALGSIDAVRLKKVTSMLLGSVGERRTQVVPPLRVTLKRLLSPEVKRGVALLVDLLAVLGDASQSPDV